MEAILRKSKRVVTPEQAAAEERRLTEIAARRKEFEGRIDPDRGLCMVVMLPSCRAIHKPTRTLPPIEKVLFDRLVKTHSHVEDTDAALCNKKLDEFHYHSILALDEWIHNLATLLNNDKEKRGPIFGLVIRRFRNDHFVEAWCAARTVDGTRYRQIQQQRKTVINDLEALLRVHLPVASQATQQATVNPPDCATS